MKALLVCLNAKYVHASPAPYLLRAGIRKFGKQVTDIAVLDATVNEAEDFLFSQILSENADFIGFSTYIWNSCVVFRLARRIKAALPSTLICLGGPETASRGSILLSEHPELDFVLEGEGECSLPALLDVLAEGRAPYGIDGLSFRDGGLISSTPPRPLPKWLSPMDGGYAEALRGRIAYLETSRGCPFHCAFCLSSEEKPVRMIDEETAVKRMIKVASSGVRTVKLVDRTFNADPARALRILKVLAAGVGRDFPRGVTFHFELSGELLDEPTILFLCSAPVGLFQFEIGLQSTNPAVLSAIGRATRYARTLDSARRLSDSGRCHIHLDLIAGLPFETVTSWEKGFLLALSARPQMLQLGFLKLLPGTRLDREREKYSLIASPEPPYAILETSTMSRAELDGLRRFEAAFDRLYNSGRHKRTLHYLIGEAGIFPLTLFREIGESLAESPAVGLDLLCERLLSLYGDAEGVERERLVDAMLTDRIATNRNTHLPSFLRRYDRRIALHKAATKDGIARGYAPLSDGRLLAARYAERDPISGEYELEEIGDCYE